MKNALTSFYDNRTGLALSLVLLAGLLAGGLLAYDPAKGAEQETDLPDQPAPTAFPAATAASISIPTPQAVETGTPDAGSTGTQTPPQAVSLENGWLWHAPDRVLNAPSPLPDGLLPVLLESGDLYFLHPDGSMAGMAQLPEVGREDDLHTLPVDFFADRIAVAILPDRVYAVQAGTGQIWEFSVELSRQERILPHYISGDVHYLLDENQVLYAYTGTDGLLWQYALAEPLRDAYTPPAPAIGDEGRIYLADRGGTVYGFDADGLAWTYKAQDDRRTTSDVLLSPDGNLYYVTASLSTGYLVSLTPEGEERWVSELATFHFTTQPMLTAGGHFVNVAEDFIEADTGTLRPIEFPFEVTEFIVGADGEDYLLTGSHVIHWEFTPDGYREIQDTSVNLGDTSQFFRPEVRVYATGLIEFRVYREQSIQVIWADPVTGGTRTFEYSWADVLLSAGSDTAEYMTCSKVPDSMVLKCEKYVPGVQDPVWELEIEGVEGGIGAFPPSVYYIDGKLYITAGERTVYVFEVDIP